MITINLPAGISRQTGVDRDGCRAFTGTPGVEGFDITVGDVQLHFQSEEDAAIIARMTLERLGQL